MGIKDVSEKVVEIKEEMSELKTMTNEILYELRGDTNKKGLIKEVKEHSEFIGKIKISVGFITFTATLLGASFSKIFSYIKEMVK